MSISTPILQKTFKTDGSATSGTATDKLTALTYWLVEGNILIVDIQQASCATRANDADWDVYANGKSTDYFLQAESIDPAYTGRAKVAFRVKDRTTLQFKWSGQGAAATNYLIIHYIPI